MDNIIKQVSEEFINEAKASPRMLEDLAAMERYMAESYDGRTFIELIQNADDAHSSRIQVFNYFNDIVVANDGRPFDENDLLAICRSGASQKRRGETIGYRGVGFKSTTSISQKIIILSAGLSFTFSKELCAERLGLPEETVPTVRIPFPYDKNSLDIHIIEQIEKLEKCGFTTFFIFQDADIKRFEDELRDFGAEWLLFLNCLDNIYIDLPSAIKSAQIIRTEITSEEKDLEVIGSGVKWRIVTDGMVAFGFKISDSTVVPCEMQEGVFHCYLPTMDPTGFAFKINADFSTDPSRKHIIKDNNTMMLMHRAEDLFVKLITDTALSQRKDMMPIIGLLQNISHLSGFTIDFRQNIYAKLSEIPWVKTSDECFKTPAEIRLLPDWLSDKEKDEFNMIKIVAAETPSEQMINGVPNFEDVVFSMGARKFSDDEILKIFTKHENCQPIGKKTLAKVIAHCAKDSSFDEKLLEEVYVPIDGDFQKLKTTSAIEKLDPEFEEATLGMLNDNKVRNLASLFPVFETLSTKNDMSKGNLKKTGTVISEPRKNLAITKWKTPIQNCLALETLLGYNSKDVSKTEKAYSIVSNSATGEKRYIAVKQISNMGDSFKISELEYDAAQRLGDEYLIFLITKDTSEVEYGYIENPYENLHLERKVKEWEWLCNEYSAVDNMAEFKTDDPIDEKILKGLSKELFNSEQWDFLINLLKIGEVNAVGKDATLGDQINFISNFYVGQDILEIKNTISVNPELIATLRKFIE